MIRVVLKSIRLSRFSFVFILPKTIDSLSSEDRNTSLYVDVDRTQMSIDRILV